MTRTRRTLGDISDTDLDSTSRVLFSASLHNPLSGRGVSNEHSSRHLIDPPLPFPGVSVYSRSQVSPFDVTAVTPCRPTTECPTRGENYSRLYRLEKTVFPDNPLRLRPNGAIL
jgi:hypothetical protein